LEVAREAAMPLPLAGAREAYLSHLRAMTPEEQRAELDSLDAELLAATNVAPRKRTH